MQICKSWWMYNIFELKSVVDTLQVACARLKMHHAWAIFASTEYYLSIFPHMTQSWQVILTLPTDWPHCSQNKIESKEAKNWPPSAPKWKELQTCTNSQLNSTQFRYPTQFCRQIKTSSNCFKSIPRQKQRTMDVGRRMWSLATVRSRDDCPWSSNDPRSF
jgi:hypothetical protein